MRIVSLTRTAAGILSCVLALACAGCWSPPRASPRQQEAGLVYMLPGIEGGPWTMKWAHDGLRAGGVQAEIRVFDWQRGPAFLENLTDYEGNLARASALAAEITAFKRERPGAPVDLVGYSGGGGLAIMVAEALPAGVHLRNVILAQAAISPDYDLTSVLSRVDGKLVNFHCPADWLILGLGTQVFGTIDRAYIESAGKEGFYVYRAVPDERLRPKLKQIEWTVEMLRAGHPGNHTGMILGEWNRRYVAPYLRP